MKRWLLDSREEILCIDFQTFYVKFISKVVEHHQNGVALRDEMNLRDLSPAMRGHQLNTKSQRVILALKQHLNHDNIAIHKNIRFSKLRNRHLVI